MILALVFPVSVRKPKAAVGTEGVWMKGNTGTVGCRGETKPQSSSSEMLINKYFQIKGTT